MLVIVYNESFEFGQKNWCTYVKKILNEMEITEIWNKQCITLLEIKAISCKLHENFIMKTFNDISNTDKYPKLCTYKTFKTEFKLENYLLTLENHGHKIALTKFRISLYNLHIETGRYERPKLEPHRRLCVYYNLQTVENEFHSLLECPLYINERNCLLQICKFEIESFSNLDLEGKFIEIMKNKKEIIIAAHGKYIYNCMIKRYKSDLNNQQMQKRTKKRYNRKNKIQAGRLFVYCCL